MAISSHRTSKSVCMQVPIEQRLNECISDEGCDVDTMQNVLSELRAESAAIDARAAQVQNVIKYLESLTVKSDEPDFAGLTLAEAALQCLDQGCPIDTTTNMIDRLKQASMELQAGGNNHDYVDQLIGALNTQRDRAISVGRTGGRL